MIVIVVLLSQGIDKHNYCTDTRLCIVINSLSTFVLHIFVLHIYVKYMQLMVLQTNENGNNACGWNSMCVSVHVCDVPTNGLQTV